MNQHFIQLTESDLLLTNGGGKISYYAGYLCEAVKHYGSKALDWLGSGDPAMSEAMMLYM